MEWRKNEQKIGEFFEGEEVLEKRIVVREGTDERRHGKRRNKGRTRLNGTKEKEKKRM